MELSDIQETFNRSLAHTFGKMKCLVIFATLAACGLLVVFFRGLAIQAGQWVTLSMTFLPIFITFGILLSVGILMIRAYYEELKTNEPAKYGEILKKSWDVIIGASYFAVPMILGYLILWIVLGVFLMLEQIPGVGDFFGVILSFVPFLLNLGAILLAILSVAALFFLTPLMALKDFSRLMVAQHLTNRLQKDPFSNILLFLIAIAPFVFVLTLLIHSLDLTQGLSDVVKNPVYATMQWFFIMIPFTALITPTVVFFFNFATEAHILIMKQNLK